MKLLLLTLAAWGLLHLLLAERRGRSPVIIAHRGAAGLAPENTLAAVQAGVASGAGLIEVDVQRTRDDVLVLMHDLGVERTTDGTGAVAELSHEEISQLDAGSWFSEEFAGERVPSLKQVLEELRGWAGVLVIEAKAPDRYPGMADQLAHIVERYRPHLSVSVVSFDHAWLAEFHRRAPDVPLGSLWLYSTRLSGGAVVQRVGVFWLSPVLDPTLTWRTHRAGLDLWVWTVDHPLLKSSLGWIGVDGITTNFP